MFFVAEPLLAYLQERIQHLDYFPLCDLVGTIVQVNFVFILNENCYMDLGAVSSSKDLVKCCNCGFSCSLISSSSGTWFRSVKRKYNEFENGNRFFIPGFEQFSVARVQVEDECVSLREMVGNQQQTIQDLYTELEEERNASSSAANEAMSMILRLQREKAETLMEARQFKRFAEEKMAHDQHELLVLEDLLYKREQEIQSLTCEVQAYKHRMLSFGLTESEIEGQGERGALSRNQSALELEAQCELPTYDYPPLKCYINESQVAFEGDDDVVDIEKYAFGETPRGRDLRNLENKMYHMERSPRKSQLDRDISSSKSMVEKVVVGESPRRSKNSRRFSNDSPSFMGIFTETCQNFNSESPRVNSFKKTEYSFQSEDYNTKQLDNASEVGDDMSDRVYTIDSVHNGVPNNSFSKSKAGVDIGEDFITTPRDSFNHSDVIAPEIKKLYTRLQALEADKESMRQAMLSMRADKAQLVLLKEIAQHLYMDVPPERRMTLKKTSLPGSFSFMSVFKVNF